MSGEDSAAWLATLSDLGAAETTDLDGYTQTELVALWTAADQHLALIASAKKKIEAALVQILDGPQVTPDGRVVKPGRSVSRTGWLKVQLREAIVMVEGRWLIDPETGAQVQALPVRSLGLFEPTTAPTKLTALGLDYKSFCTETWTDKLDVVL